MLRSRLMPFIVVVLLLMLALPALARAGETVDQPPSKSVVRAVEPIPDGWTWDEAAPAPDGWTWDEVRASG